MNAQDARQAVDYALSSFEGEPVYVDDSTIVIGMDSEQAEYAETVYATPDEWGNITVYADEAGMQTTIASLIDAGGEEWAGINLGDCAEWDLVQVVNGLGLYKEQHVRSDSFMALRLVDGDYQEVYFDGFAGRRIAQYGSMEDAIEELSE